MLGYMLAVSIPKRVSEALNLYCFASAKMSSQVVSIPKRVSEALNLKYNPTELVFKIVSIPKRVSEALNHPYFVPVFDGDLVSIPKRVSEALNQAIKSGLQDAPRLFQSLKGFQRL